MELVGAERRDVMGAAGTPEEPREERQSFLDIEGVDAVSVSFPRGTTTGEVERTMETLAPGSGPGSS